MVTLILGATITLSLGQPAWSQEESPGSVPTDDALEGPDSYRSTNTLGLAPLDPLQLDALMASAQPPANMDPWRNGSSAAESWQITTTANLSAQRTELQRLDIESSAARARTEVAARAYASTVNRDQVVGARYTALIVDQFVNGEADDLDKLNGQNATLYVGVPTAVATQTLGERKVRSAAAAKQSGTIAAARALEGVAVEAVAFAQQSTVRVAQTLDASARTFSLDHVGELRRREARTLEVSGEAPEVVAVGGFMVSPEIAESLGAMLQAAAAAGDAVEEVVTPTEDSDSEGDPAGVEVEPPPPPQPIILGGWGYRTTEEQIGLRESHCGSSGYVIFDGPSPGCSPPTARPLHSEHEKGLAIDFTENGAILTSASPAFAWLRANAATYGFINLPSEPWHWSTTGH